MITIEQILNCKKIINKKRRPDFTTDQRHYRMNIDLDCDEPNLKMVMFIRKLVASPEQDFTVGLRLDSPNPIADYTLVLVRFQGPHGGQSINKSMNDLHNSYHIHTFTEEDLMLHRKLASFKSAGNFNSFEEAIVEFLSYCNIDDPNGIFDNEFMAVTQFKMDLERL